MNKVIKEIKEATGYVYEYEFENIVFHNERLSDLLNSSKHINKEDREMLSYAVFLLREIKRVL